MRVVQPASGRCSRRWLSTKFVGVIAVQLSGYTVQTEMQSVLTGENRFHCQRAENHRLAMHKVIGSGAGSEGGCQGSEAHRDGD
jgi:hypothetical protein